MSNTSVIYKNIHLYRFMMFLLYKGQYGRRFKDILNLIEDSDKRLLELCFGDIFIASYCRKQGLHWTGYDINPGFVHHAIKKGFRAELVNLIRCSRLPTADVCIMAGSLYHFHSHLETVFSKMLGSSPKLIISEPVMNYSSSGGVVGYLAKRSANAGKGDEQFRFNEHTLLKLIEDYQKKFKFEYEVISKKRDLLLRITHHGSQHNHSRL